MSSEAGSLPYLTKLGFLNKSHIKIKNPEKTEKLLEVLIGGGFNKLQLVVDYDFTMTKLHDEKGERCHSSWGALDVSPLVPEFYRTEALSLLEKYYPIEISTTIPEAEKIPHMEDWYGKQSELLERCSITKSNVKTIACESYTLFRTGTEEMMAALHKAGVPVLVLSAGMGDILLGVFNKYSLVTDNVKIVSNFFKYDEQERAKGFEGEMIHVFNKNESAIQSSPYFEVIAARNNVMLMGDSLGDVQMAVGVPTPNTILRIGFLNDKIKERMALYEDAYDIVLVDDQTMDAANAIVALMK